MIVKDGMNDISILLMSNISIGVVHEENNVVKNL